MKTPIQEPLRFERIFLEKVWGGRALAKASADGGLGLNLPEGMQVGETWELVDRADVCSRVATGRFVGKGLDELIGLNQLDLLGDTPLARGGRFPLLVKYIDAAAHLSVQVHPDDAHATGEREAKTEAWVILGCAEGGRIYHGFTDCVTRESLAAALEVGRVEACLRSFEPKAGECYFVPGGTVHAIGAGVTLIEVQQNSDTTFRVDDWGRLGLDGKPRDLHVEEALGCLDFGTAPDPVQAPDFCGEALELASCDAFAMGVVDVELGGARAFSTSNRGAGAPIVLACVAGAGVLRYAGGDFAIGLGDVVLVPAALGDFEVLNATTATTTNTAGATLRLIDMRGPQPA